MPKNASFLVLERVQRYTIGFARAGGDPAALGSGVLLRIGDTRGWGRGFFAAGIWRNERRRPLARLLARRRGRKPGDCRYPLARHCIVGGSSGAAPADCLPRARPRGVHYRRRS
jgi:hypothetical protein